MPLNLSDIVKNPDLLTFKIPLPSGELVILRPLEIDDVDPLAQFLEKLSPMTREYYVLDSYDASTAKELCDAISHYDKLRFVLVNDSNQK